MGGRGFSITRHDQIENVLNRALSTDGPVVIEAVVDPYEPMMPPKMPPDYAKNFRKALPETPYHERIEANTAEEPLKTMMDADT